MRKTIVITSAIMLVGMISIAGLWGCKSESATQPINQPNSDRSQNSDNSLPFGAFTVSTSYGQVDVVGVESVPEEMLVRMRLLVHRNGLLDVERLLTTQLSSDTPSNISFEATLGLDAYTPLWQVEFVVWGDNSKNTTTILRSGHDSLVATHAETAEGVVETYLTNETFRTYEMSFAEVAHVDEVYRAGLVDGEFRSEAIPNRSPADKQLIAMLRDCQELYDHAPLLHLNDDAGLAEQLLQNDKVVRTIRACTGTADDQEVIDKWWHKLCAAAGICSYYVCRYFGPNGVCLTCGAVSLTCALYTWATS